MGRKGVSKRKPKKSNSVSNDNIIGSSKVRPGESPSVHLLVKDNGAAPNRGGAYPVAGSNKKGKNGK